MVSLARTVYQERTADALGFHQTHQPADHECRRNLEPLHQRRSSQWRAPSASCESRSPVRPESSTPPMQLIKAGFRREGDRHATGSWSSNDQPTAVLDVNGWAGQHQEAGGSNCPQVARSL